MADGIRPLPVAVIEIGVETAWSGYGPKPDWRITYSYALCSALGVEFHFAIEHGFLELRSRKEDENVVGYGTLSLHGILKKLAVATVGLHFSVV